MATISKDLLFFFSTAGEESIMVVFKSGSVAIGPVTIADLGL